MIDRDKSALSVVILSFLNHQPWLSTIALLIFFVAVPLFNYNVSVLELINSISLYVMADFMWKLE